jgi:hypothetical protein
MSNLSRDLVATAGIEPVLLTLRQLRPNAVQPTNVRLSTATVYRTSSIVLV